MNLVLKKLSSFNSSDSPIKILDEKGNIFYIHPNRERKISFNLPAGNYSTENNLKEVAYTPYVRSLYPNLFERIKGYKIFRGHNPNKATITPMLKKIKIANKVNFKDGSQLDINEFKPCLIYLLGHEAAHTIAGSNKYNADGTILFDAEQACDNISENWMLANGYNPTQIKLCKQLLLSSPERQKHCQYNSKQMNFRR